MIIRRVQGRPMPRGFLVLARLWHYPWGWEWDYEGIAVVHNWREDAP